MNTKPSFSRKLAARLVSALVWNREARHALRDAMLCDYKNDIRELQGLVHKNMLEIQKLREFESQLEARISALNAKIAALSPRPPQPYRIDGKDNRIVIIEKNGHERLLARNERIPGLEISICGDDNEIRIHARSSIAHSRIEIGFWDGKARNNHVRIKIMRGTVFERMYLRCAYGECQRFTLGESSRMRGGVVILDETGGCLIGNDCNCADEIHIWGSDGHAILDKNDPSKILNEIEGPVTIGDHTWIGQSVRLQKNARVPANSIVAAGSIVTKAFNEEYTILAGVPAKVVKREVMREPKTLSAYFLKQKNFSR